MSRKEIDETILSRLYELLSQDQFELLPPWDGGQVRLVYLMNDAVESFLIFEEAVLTGYYDAHYEGELEAELRREEDGRYVLMVHQGESVCTIFFHDLSLEVHPYDYGKTGHVWMKGSEELRQIEYWIAIMKAKVDYLGEEFCSEQEKRLSHLEAFPPLNVCSYPAVPRQYYEPREDAWEPTPEGIRVMKSLAQQANDRKLERAMVHYEKHHGKRQTRHIAAMLRRSSHNDVVDLLIRQIRKASGVYPDRVFLPEEEKRFVGIRREAERRKAILEAQGKTVYLFCQMPFAAAKDEVEFKAHLLVIGKGLRNRIVQVETFMNI